MAWRWSLSLLIVALVAVAVVVAVAAGRENRTAASGGLSWSTAKEEVDLLRKKDPAILDDRDDMDGGFSLLDGIIQWAICHYDPAKLKEIAQDVRKMSANELKKR